MNIRPIINDAYWKSIKSGTFLNALQLLTHLILTPILQIKHQYFYPHFTDKETKAQ